MEPSHPTIKVENGTDVMLTLLYAGGANQSENEEIVGNTRLVKLIFLLEQETSLRKYLTDFKYEPYDYGPFSSELFDAIQALTNAGLVKQTESKSEGYLDEADRYEVESEASENLESPRSTMVYSLTPEGMTVATALYNSLSQREQQELIETKRRFNSIGLRKLLQYIYRTYPKYAAESVIKETLY